MNIKNKNGLKSNGDLTSGKPKKKNRDYEVTIHHIIPRSRNGSDTKPNKVKIPRRIHDLYHQIFGNMTPTEVCAYMETYFFGGQTKYIDEYVSNREKIEKEIE